MKMDNEDWKDLFIFIICMIGFMAVAVGLFYVIYFAIAIMYFGKEFVRDNFFTVAIVFIPVPCYFIYLVMKEFLTFCEKEINNEII